MTSKLLTFIFLLFLTSGVFAQQLEKKITIDLKDKSLEEVIEYLHEHYNVDFSYINNELPVETISLKYTNKPLREVLTELLEETELGFVEYDDQVIIQRGIRKSQKQDKPSQPAPKVDEQPQPAEAQSNVLVQPSPADVTASVDTIEIMVPEEKERVNTDNNNHYPPVPDYSSRFNESALAHFFEKNYEPSEYIRKPYHFGVFYPLSTNGIEAGKYVNQLSFHFLVGFSAGLEGFEASLIGNVAKDYVNGFQFGGLFNVLRNDITGSQAAGLANVAGGESKGLQVAGLANIAGKGSKGAQVAGVANLSGEDSDGLQVSGVVNITDGNFKGVQTAGVVNIANGNVDGFQASGVLNIADGHLKSGQVSGFLNIAKDVYGLQVGGFGNIQNGNGKNIQVSGFINQARDIDGVQVAGFINQARRMKGMQVAGFINIAKSMKGVQIGVINIADSLQGLPIGLFSIVKKNGYYDLEFFYDDDFDANATLKIGAQKFHNIFGFSYEKLAYEKGETNRWALGYGFGAQFGRKTLRLNTDLMGYHVFERNIDDKPFTDYELNLLGKFRMLAGIHIGNFGIFAGPVFNAMVSQHQDPESGVIGSQLVTETFFNETYNNRTNVKFWMGYNIGIRF